MAEKKDPAPLTAGDVQKMIDDALAKFKPDLEVIVVEATAEIAKGLPASIDERLKALDFPKLAADAVHKIDGKLFAGIIEEHVDFVTLVDLAIEQREQRLADAAAITEKAAAAERAEAEAARVKNDQAAAKRAEKQARADADALAKKIDRAVRDYGSLIVQPVPSGLAFDAAKSITLRFGDGATFHPEHHLELGADDLNDELGRLVNTKVIDLPAEAVPFTASEALLIVEGGKEPSAIYRSPIESPLRFGGGSTAQLATGALAFRRLSPVPEPVT